MPENVEIRPFPNERIQHIKNELLSSLDIPGLHLPELKQAGESYWRMRRVYGPITPENANIIASNCITDLQVTEEIPPRKAKDIAVNSWDGIVMLSNSMTSLLEGYYPDDTDVTANVLQSVWSSLKDIEVIDDEVDVDGYFTKVVYSTLRRIEKCKNNENPEYRKYINPKYSLQEILSVLPKLEVNEAKILLSSFGYYGNISKRQLAAEFNIGAYAVYNTISSAIEKVEREIEGNQSGLLRNQTEIKEILQEIKGVTIYHFDDGQGIVSPNYSTFEIIRKIKRGEYSRDKLTDAEWAIITTFTQDIASGDTISGTNTLIESLGINANYASGLLSNLAKMDTSSSRYISEFGVIKENTSRFKLLQWLEESGMFDSINLCALNARERLAFDLMTKKVPSGRYLDPHTVDEVFLRSLGLTKPPFDVVIPKLITKLELQPGQKYLQIRNVLESILPNFITEDLQIATKTIITAIDDRMSLEGGQIVDFAKSVGVSEMVFMNLISWAQDLYNNQGLDVQKPIAYENDKYISIDAGALDDESVENQTCFRFARILFGEGFPRYSLTAFGREIAVLFGDYYQEYNKLPTVEYLSSTLDESASRVRMEISKSGMHSKDRQVFSSKEGILNTDGLRCKILSKWGRLDSDTRKAFLGSFTDEDRIMFQLLVTTREGYLLSADEMQKLWNTQYETVFDVRVGRSKLQQRALEMLDAIADSPLQVDFDLEMGNDISIDNIDAETYQLLLNKITQCDEGSGQELDSTIEGSDIEDGEIIGGARVLANRSLFKPFIEEIKPPKRHRLEKMAILHPANDVKRVSARSAVETISKQSPYLGMVVKDALAFLIKPKIPSDIDDPSSLSKFLADIGICMYDELPIDYTIFECLGWVVNERDTGINDLAMFTGMDKEAIRKRLPIIDIVKQKLLRLNPNERTELLNSWRTIVLQDYQEIFN